MGAISLSNVQGRYRRTFQAVPSATIPGAPAQQRKLKEAACCPVVHARYQKMNP
jgi:hypothetical protein